MTAEPLLIGLLFFAAAAAGWGLARFGSRERVESGRVPPAKFYRGLDHVLRNESDKALDVLQSLADADPGVVEIHFALATLFRQRGETDRAIRIHRDLLARPNLARAHREQALYDLAEDYQRAGLYDRAESVFLQLIDHAAFRSRALRHLVSIYERQRDWDQAIEMRRKLAASSSGAHGEIIAQYYCEKAALAQAGNDLATMRAALRSARKEHRDIVRGALMRADLAILRDDKPLAKRLYGQVLETEPRLAAIVMEGLDRCCGADKDALDEVLARSMLRAPGIGAELGKTQLASGRVASDVAAAAARDLLSADPAIAALGGNDMDIARARAALHALGLARLEYLCAQCGYRALELNWQCPACSYWDTSRPDIRLTATRPTR